MGFETFGFGGGRADTPSMMALAPSTRRPPTSTVISGAVNVRSCAFVFGSNSQLRALAEVYATPGSA